MGVVRIRTGVYGWCCTNGRNPAGSGTVGVFNKTARTAGARTKSITMPFKVYAVADVNVTR